MSTTTRRFTNLLLSASFIAGTLGFAPGTARTLSDEPTYTTGTITSGDAELATQLWRPPGIDVDTPTPVILHVTPYASSSNVPSAAAEGMLDRAMAQGWSVAVVSLRGYGGSTGCGDLFGDGERLDVATAVQWANDAPWSTGQVAMYGLSYDAMSALMAMDQGLDIDAAVLASPATSVHGSVYENGVPVQMFRHVAFFYLLSQAFEGAVPDCMAEIYAQSQLERSSDHPFWQLRDWTTLQDPAGYDVPVYWTAGFFDQAIVSETWDLLGRMTGPTAGQFGHQPHWWGFRTDWRTESFAFLEDVFAGVTPETGFDVQDQLGHWRVEEQWPPADIEPFTFELLGGSYLDLAGPDYVDFAKDAVWTVTEPAVGEVRISGEGSIAVDASWDGAVHAGVPADDASPRAIATVYDVAPDGQAHLMTRGAKLLDEPGPATFRLHHTDWALRPGHRIAVAVSGADESFFEGGTTGLTVTVGGGTATLPTLATTREAFIDGGVPSGAVTSATTSLSSVLADRTVAATPPAALPGSSKDGAARRDVEPIVVAQYTTPMYVTPGVVLSFANVEEALIFDWERQGFVAPDQEGSLAVTVTPHDATDVDVILVENPDFLTVPVRSMSLGIDTRTDGLWIQDMVPGMRYGLLVRSEGGALVRANRPTLVDVLVQFYPAAT